MSLAHNANILLGCVYIPPSSPLALYRDFCDAVTEINEQTNHLKIICIFGDFNLPEFVSNSSSKLNHHCRASEQLLDMSSIHALHQVNHIRNHRGVTMDLIFCLDQETLASKSFDWLVPPDDHHPPLAIALCWSSFMLRLRIAISVII